MQFKNDRNEDRYNDYGEHRKESKNMGQTFINFTSASERAITAKSAGKTRQRGNDLLSMIELDVSSFSIFDLPPVKEYDLYIRNFGRTNTKQVSFFCPRLTEGSAYLIFMTLSSVSRSEFL